MSDEVERAINNKNNENITNFTREVIATRKKQIFNQLTKTPSDFLKKLKEYRHVDELTEIRLGCYIRWMRADSLKLTNGGVVLKVDLTENGTNITVKNNMGRLFTLKLDDNFVFQRITDQEDIILSIIDKINKK